MSNKYLYIGNKTFKGPLGMEKPVYDPTIYGIWDASIRHEVKMKLWNDHLDSLPSIPYAGKEDDFKVDQICEEGKEIRVEDYCCTYDYDWGKCERQCLHAGRMVILPNTPVVSESKEKDNVPSDYQRLFNAISETNRLPLESDMQEIIRIVHEDFPKEKDNIPSSFPQCTLSNEVLIEKCKEWVSQLCKTGGRAWNLHIPVDLERDPDILFSELIRRFEGQPLPLAPNQNQKEESK